MQLQFLGAATTVTGSQFLLTTGQAKVLAIGETGIDLYHDKTHEARQRVVFIEQMRLAQRIGKPVVIHSRSAVDECLAVMADFPEVPAVFHCFTGTVAEAQRVLQRGYYLGFTGPVGRQVVLTGGGAELKNIADYMQGVLGRAVRVGRPKTITGLPDAHSGPAFATLVGLAMLGAGGSGDLRDLALGTVIERKSSQGFIGRLVSAMKGGF